MKIKKSKYLLLIVSAIAFILSQIVFIASFFKGEEFEKMYFFPTDVFSDKKDEKEWNAIRAALQNYHLTLQYPSETWLGQAVLIHLIISPDGSPSLPQMNDRVSFVLKTNLEMPGATINPGKEILLPIHSSQKATIQWEVTSAKHEILQGRLWVSLLKSIDPEVVTPILVLPLTIKIRSSFGLTISQWRILWLCLSGMSVFIWIKIRSELRKIS